MALEHEFKMVEKCMLLVEKIYEKGNVPVKNAVENVFIFSFSSIMTICNIVEWRIVQSFMPSCLYSLYIKQVLQSKKWSKSLSYQLACSLDHLGRAANAVVKTDGHFPGFEFWFRA